MRYFAHPRPIVAEMIHCWRSAVLKLGAILRGASPVEQQAEIFVQAGADRFGDAAGVAVGLGVALVLHGLDRQLAVGLRLLIRGQLDQR
jgi:hypothetical protein